jgi:hypothetical protein
LDDFGVYAGRVFAGHGVPLMGHDPKTKSLIIYTPPDNKDGQKE